METNLTAFALQDICLVLGQHNQQYNVIKNQSKYLMGIKGKQFLLINASRYLPYNLANSHAQHSRGDE